MKTVRAKFRCNSIEENEWDKKVRMTPVMDGSDENKDFNTATPSGNLEVAIHGEVPAASFFKIGKEYYMDFTEAIK
jgi:hypothetical protein